MADYRLYRRTAASFDGTTAETGTYTQIGKVYTTTAVGAVGVFSAAIIGRQQTASLVRVFPQAGTIAGGDAVSAVAPGGFIRRSVPLLQQGNVRTLLLSSADQLVVRAPALTGAEIMVEDLDDAQMVQWLAGYEAGVDALTGEPANAIVITGDVSLAAWAASPQNFQIPAGTAASNITLPTSDLEQGAVGNFLNLSANNQTLVAPAINGAVNLTLAAGDSAQLTWDNSVGWYAIVSA